MPEVGIIQPVCGFTISDNIDKTWHMTTLTSDLPSSKLPLSLEHDGVRILFRVEYKPDPKAVPSAHGLRKNQIYLKEIRSFFSTIISTPRLIL